MVHSTVMAIVLGFFLFKIHLNHHIGDCVHADKRDVQLNCRPAVCLCFLLLSCNCSASQRFFFPPAVFFRHYLCLFCFCNEYKKNRCVFLLYFCFIVLLPLYLYLFLCPMLEFFCAALCLLLLLKAAV